MEQQLPTLFIICTGFLLADFYIIGGVRAGLKKWKFVHQRSFSILYWAVSIVFVAGIFLSIFLRMGLGARSVFLLGFFLMGIGEAAVFALLC